MFGINTRGLPSLGNYTRAFERWANTKPWRGYSERDERPLDDSRKKKHMTIRRGPSNEIICRLYRTDMITYHESGEIDVYIGHTSKSSQAFVSEVYGRGYINLHDGVVWERYPHNSRGYLVNGDWASFDAEGMLTNPKPIRIPKIDVKRANAVRRDTGFNQFVDWVTAYRGMNPPDYISRYDRNRWNDNDVVEHLCAGPDRWVDMVHALDNWYILQCIYRADGKVIRHEDHAAFEDDNMYRSWKSLTKKYWWAL